MKQINVNPYVENGWINVGFIGDHNETELIFDVEGSGFYLKVQTSQKEFEQFPIPENKFVLTSTYTQKSPLQIQLVKIIDGQLIAHGNIINLSLKQSIKPSDKVIEVVPPNFKTAYDNMVEVTETINQAYEQGYFIPNLQIGTVETLPQGEKAYATITGDKANPILNLGIPTSGGGTGGTDNYELLLNLPQINGVELKGNKTLDDLGIKQKYTAEDITFEDGQTFQEKYDSGELKGQQGERGIQGERGEKGQDGFSPIVETTPLGNGTQVSITDETGVKTFDVLNGENGKDGANGQDGYTPQKGVDYFTEADKEEFTKEIESNLSPLLDDKLDKQQGVENSGKVLGVGEDGLVKAVEMSGGSGELKLVKEITLDEEVMSVEFDTDNDNAPFELSKVYVKLSANANSEGTTQVYRIHINDEQSYQSGDNQLPKTGSKYFYTKLVFLDGYWLTEFSRNSTYQNGYPMTSSGGWVSSVYNSQLAKKIKIQSFVNFGVGTKITIYGR